jgi:hypothetical protein
MTCFLRIKTKKKEKVIKRNIFYFFKISFRLHIITFVFIFGY